MTREIKFRAWDKRLGKYVCLLSLTNKGEAQVTEYTSPDRVKPLQYWLSSDEVVLEQDTGLKDKNGERICEGDIVQIAGERASIVFDEELASYMGRFLVEYHNQILESNDYIHAFCPHDIEVIGNIHENPELLKKGEQNE